MVGSALVCDFSASNNPVDVCAVTKYNNSSEDFTIYGNNKTTGAKFCCTYEDSGAAIEFVELKGTDGDDNLKFWCDDNVIARLKPHLGSTYHLTGKIFAASGADVINGSDFHYTTAYYKEYLYGEAGTDTVYGRAGPDYIHGGADSDTIYADQQSDGAHPDVVFGDGGADTIYGYDGADYIAGGDDADTVWGGDGSDHIDGRSGADTLAGEDGEDVIYAESGVYDDLGDADFLNGGADKDTLCASVRLTGASAGDGGDTLYGDDGDDVLYYFQVVGAIFGDPPNIVSDAGPLGTDECGDPDAEDTIAGCEVELTDIPVVCIDTILNDCEDLECIYN